MNWDCAARRVREATRRGILGRCWRVHQLETDYALFETEVPRVGHILVVRVVPRRGGYWECSHLIKIAQGFIGERRHRLPRLGDYLAILDHVERLLDGA